MRASIAVILAAALAAPCGWADAKLRLAFDGSDSTAQRHRVPAAQQGLVSPAPEQPQGYSACWASAAAVAPIPPDRAFLAPLRSCLHGGLLSRQSNRPTLLTLGCMLTV